MATREATPPPVIGKAGRYTVFITPPATPRPSEGSRSQSSSPSPSPKISPRNVAPLPSETFRSLSSSAREKMRSNLSPKVGESLPVKSPVVAPPPPPPVQVPPPQFEKGKAGKSSGSFGFFWDAVAKVQNGIIYEILWNFWSFGFFNNFRIIFTLSYLCSIVTGL